MKCKHRRYKLLADFAAVHRFLTEVYSPDTLNSYLLPEFFEYAHTHPAFNHKLTHRFGLWEDCDRVVAIACYEMDIGQSFLVTDVKHAFLLPEMLHFAEQELSVAAGSKHSLSVWITDKETDKVNLLRSQGYSRVYTEPVRIFPYNQSFPQPRLRDGFSLLSLDDDNDHEKIHTCLWKGFDHKDEPDHDIDCRWLMQSGPNFRKDLTTVVKAPNGDYACFAGMWFNEANGYAYLEPLATVPKYRGLGLATMALCEAMRKTKALGADYCFGGAGEFYTTLEFETTCYREMWRKEFGPAVQSSVP